MSGKKAFDPVMDYLYKYQLDQFFILGGKYAFGSSKQGLKLAFTSDMVSQRSKQYTEAWKSAKANMIKEPNKSVTEVYINGWNWFLIRLTEYMQPQNKTAVEIASQLKTDFADLSDVPLPLLTAYVEFQMNPSEPVVDASETETLVRNRLIDQIFDKTLNPT